MARDVIVVGSAGAVNAALQHDQIADLSAPS
jgi:hypothetical protein